jgi:hypothetical protein
MGRRFGSWRSSFIIILLLVSQCLILIPSKTDGMGSPSITIQLEDSRKKVEVSPGSSGVLTFNGTVIAEAPIMPPGQYLVVTLMADAGGWAVSVPPSLVFSNNVTEQPFSLSVQVPIETSVKTQGQLSVSGKWRYSPGSMGGSIEPATAIIEVEQYYSYAVSPKEMLTKIGTDSISEVVFEIINKGNAADRLTLEVMNKDELESSGVQISIKTEDISVPEKQTREYPVAIITLPSTSPGRFEIEVRVHSIQADSMNKEFEYEYTSCFIEVIEGYVDEDPDPLPTDGDDDDSDNSTILPDGPFDQYSLPDSNPIDRIMMYAGIIIGTLFVLIVALYLFRKVKGS